MKALTGKVAVVAGAGRGIACMLGEAGATGWSKPIESCICRRGCLSVG